MAHPGQVLKAGGLTLTVRRSDAEALELMAVYPPLSPIPPDHFHPEQTERFEVVSGEMQVCLEGERFALREGQVLEIPPLRRHQMWNSGEGEARVRWEVRPALKTGLFYERVAELEDEGRPLAAERKDLLQVAVMMAEYDRELRLVKPPRAVQKLLIWLVAPVGWLAGYRAHPRRGDGE